MMYVIPPNLYIVLYFVSLIIKKIKKVFISYFAMSCIIVYSTIIIPNALSKVVNCMEFGVIKR